ncbi:MAG: hypothetical protein HC839_01085, partial [Leptolyngbyaceae cyanobacterium RM2_2_21]|nr:hypothetical protein [Leptolyngbyaceae cyanobacterium RM2_2_21]
MLEWVTNIIASMGYAGIVFLMFLENVFPPIPSEIIMPLAGFRQWLRETSTWRSLFSLAHL